MKYVYRAMSLGQNCTKLLQWHEKLYEKVRDTSRQTGRQQCGCLVAGGRLARFDLQALTLLLL